MTFSHLNCLSANVTFDPRFVLGSCSPALICSHMRKSQMGAQPPYWAPECTRKTEWTEAKTVKNRHFLQIRTTQTLAPTQITSCPDDRTRPWAVKPSLAPIRKVIQITVVRCCRQTLHRHIANVLCLQCPTPSGLLHPACLFRTCVSPALHTPFFFLYVHCVFAYHLINV
ncbi:hypothetical protein PUMCH_004281 [Australozyma saopauloensis]|uniref:Uncharacterized protein n=1 Tax=Australozyma saopauloensis TaxID=291208 RepID=A0AAX4HEJ5_9ASCO|nr:hypothetical protein PUMCH_004281 [[Candida] saopauloensis]